MLAVAVSPTRLAALGRSFTLGVLRALGFCTFARSGKTRGAGYRRMPSLYPAAIGLPTDPPLPPGWEEQSDAASGAAYFFNSASGEISFERPVAGVRPQTSTAASDSSTSAQRQGSSSSAPRVVQPSMQPQQQQQSEQPSFSSSFSRRSRLSVASAAGSLLTSASAAMFGTPRPESAAPIGPARPRVRVQAVIQPLPDRPGSYAVDVPMHGRQEGGHYSEHKQSSGPARIGIFHSEAAALAAARHESPPSWTDSETCQRCGQGFGLFRRRTHCRNCGYSMCRSCTKAWPRAALPALFPKDNGERTCNVCLACDDAANAFRAALVSGDADAARRVYGTCDTWRWHVAQRLTSMSCCPEAHLSRPHHPKSPITSRRLFFTI